MPRLPLACVALLGTFLSPVYAAAGVTRFAQSIQGPVTLLFAAMYVDGVWKTRQEGYQRAVAARGLARRMVFVLVVATVVISASFLALPLRWGRAVAGETFVQSRTPMLAYTSAQIIAAFGTAAMSGLRFVGRVGSAARVRLVWAALVVTGAPVGAWLGGAVGYFAALGVANLVGAVLWWRRFREAIAADLGSHLVQEGLTQ